MYLAHHIKLQVSLKYICKAHLQDAHSFLKGQGGRTLQYHKHHNQEVLSLMRLSTYAISTCLINCGQFSPTQIVFVIFCVQNPGRMWICVMWWLSPEVEWQSFTYPIYLRCYQKNTYSEEACGFNASVDSLLSHISWFIYHCYVSCIHCFEVSLKVWFLAWKVLLVKFLAYAVYCTSRSNFTLSLIDLPLFDCVLPSVHGTQHGMQMSSAKSPIEMQRRTGCGNGLA